MPNPDTVSEKPWNRQDLRVPRADGTLFSRPSLAEAADVVRRNHAALHNCRANLQGRTVEQLRAWSRDEVLKAACLYTEEISGESVSVPSSELLIAGGHQPSLFHPGVWVKNFALGELARQTNGVALNLVVDNDTLSTSRIRVPAGTREHPTNETIAFDDARPTQPWEDLEIQNRGLFESFGTRVTEQMSAWGITPLAATIWPDVLDTSNRTASLRDCFTAARHRLERKWGTANLELPISRLCELDPFLWFASHILAQLPQFRSVYNEVLQQYRSINRIRSKTHPVPELTKNDGWIEAPFWVWRKGEQQRKHLFAKQVDKEVHLSDGRETFAKLPLTPEMEACCAMEILRELPAQGIRLRTRALTTTLFSRICLSDLFVHGIGGAKYDEMTDRIISRFFKIPAPEFLTLSATLQIPLAEPYAVTHADECRLTHLLRDLRYNSDRHMPEGVDGEATALIAEKTKLIKEQHAAQTTDLSRRERRLRTRDNHGRFRRFQEVDRQLATFTSDQRVATVHELAIVREQLTANAILTDREFSFCLYPEETLKAFMSGLSG